jgi:hypothetical protein
MKQILMAALILSSLSLAACSKTSEQTAAESASTVENDTPAAAPETAQSDAERAEKQALMDYATMEDKYINDPRGSRTWFVRKFDKTSYAASAAKITIANNVQRGYKVVDAVQLVGD